MEPAIKVQGISKTFRIPKERYTSLKQNVVHVFKKREYNEFNVLTDINFEVARGEFLGIIGKNGGGKSTLLKILAGIYSADSGNVVMDGKLAPFLELGVGFNPELTGRENIFLGGAILGLTRKQVEERYEQIVEFSELREFIDMKLKNYSSGMQVRLAFSLSINVNAEILLMDEVLAVGDSNFQAKCIDEFLKYKKQGKTVILVTHDIEAVRKYCDKAILIRNGKIQKIGLPEDVTQIYMQQNAVDMAARKAELRASITGGKTGLPMLEKVEFLSAKGEKKDHYKTGDTLKIRLHFSNPKKLAHLNFGIALYGENNEYITGTNTIAENIDTTKYVKDKAVEISFRNLPLLSGRYIVRAAIYGDTDSHIYDFVERLAEFNVVSSTRKEGMLDIEHEWD